MIFFLPASNSFFSEKIKLIYSSENLFSCIIINDCLKKESLGNLNITRESVNELLKKPFPDFAEMQ